VKSYTGSAAMRAHEARAHQREGHAEQDRLRQDEQARDGELRAEREPFVPEAREEMVVRPVRDDDKNGMKHQRSETDRRLDDGVAGERVGDARGPAAAIRRAGRHAAHEHREDQRLRVRRVAQEELQVMRPDRLVDESGKARSGEEAIERAARHRARC
jgi:hypothetical protein